MQYLVLLDYLFYSYYLYKFNHFRLKINVIQFSINPVLFLSICYLLSIDGKQFCINGL